MRVSINGRSPFITGGDYRAEYTAIAIMVLPNTIYYGSLQNL
jgi:hypothetical protein